MPEPSVLILGCGVGGVVAAREARRLLPASHRVTIIDKDAEASLPSSYPWVLTGERRPDAIKRRRAHLASKGIEFAQAEVRQIDLANRYVKADSREFRYDYLVLALGAELNLESRPGVAEASHGFYTLESAERLAATLRYFAGGRIVIAIAGLPYKGPTAPYEAAMLIEHSFHARRIRQNVELAIYTPETLPLEAMGRENGEAVAGLLAHKGIEFHPQMQIVSADPARREVRFADGSGTPFQVLITIPEHRAPVVVRETGLVDESGWIPVSPRNLETSHENVFAIGDLTQLRTASGLPLPKLGFLAERQAEAVAGAIAYKIKGGRLPAPFQASGRSFLEVGASAGAMLEGDLLSRDGAIAMKQPSIAWHLAKAVLERYWLLRTY